MPLVKLATCIIVRDQQQRWQKVTCLLVTFW